MPNSRATSRWLAAGLDSSSLISFSRISSLSMGSGQWAPPPRRPMRSTVEHKAKRVGARSQPTAVRGAPRASGDRVNGQYGDRDVVENLRDLRPQRERRDVLGVEW